jgi:hypothetical protein
MANTTREPGYYVTAHDWPADSRPDELSLDEVYAVLDDFDAVYEAARHAVDIGVDSAEESERAGTDPS